MKLEGLNGLVFICSDLIWFNLMKCYIMEVGKGWGVNMWVSECVISE